MELLILLVVACAGTLAFALISVTRPAPAKRRVARLADGSKPQIESIRPGGILPDENQSWIVRFLTPLAMRTAPTKESTLGPIRKRLVQAGYRGSSAVTIFMGSRVGIALAIPALLFLIPAVWYMPQLQLVGLLCCGAGIGYVAPSYYIDKRGNSRRNGIQLGLPDALDLMVVCVEAGLGINACMSRVASEFTKSHPVLSAEFELVTLEVRAGKSMSEALRGFKDRSGVTQISSLVAMLIQTERFGTNLADTLRVHADAMRVQRMQRAEEQANKAPLKMLFPTVIIFIATLLVTVGPGMIQMLAFFEG